MQKTAYEMRISDGSSDVCSSDLVRIKRSGTATDSDVFENEIVVTAASDGNHQIRISRSSMPGLADIIIDSNFIDGLRGLVDLAIVEADKLHTYSAGGTPSSTVGALNQGSNGIYRSAPTGQFSAITNPDGRDRKSTRLNSSH